MSAIAKRYASALMDVARESGSLEPVGKDLHDLKRLIDASDAFQSFLADPLIDPAEQQACIAKLCGEAACPLLRNLFKVLISRERLDILSDIVDIGIDLWQTEMGILPVSVVSASKMSAEQQKALVAKLSERTGKEIELHADVDDALIGGFRLKIGDQVEDHSLAAKLETFKRNVINA